MIIGYARVSTAGQDLAGQIEELKNKGAQKIYSEKFTGTRVDRPVFKKVLKKLKKGDTLMVTKLDRFVRNTVEAIQVVKKLFDKKIAIHILNIGIIEDTPTGRLIFNVFSAFAEFERDMIVTRTQEGKMYARMHNHNFKKEYTVYQLDLAMKLLETDSYHEVEKKTGISVSTLYREHKKRLETAELEKNS